MKLCEHYVKESLQFPLSHTFHVTTINNKYATQRNPTVSHFGDINSYCLLSVKLQAADWVVSDIASRYIWPADTFGRSYIRAFQQSL
jgi:hypothetical protein